MPVDGEEHNVKQRTDSNTYGRFKISTIDRPRGSRQLISYVHFEEVLERINPFGSYQIFACIFILYATIEWTGNTAFPSVLGAVEPTWDCLLSNGTVQSIKISTDDDADCAYINTNCVELNAQKDSVEFYSIVAAWKLICNDKDKLNYIQLIQAVGCFVGAFVGGHIGDQFGRMTGFFTSQLCIQITSVMTVAANSWISFAVCQCLNGFFYGLIEVMSLTLMMEYTNNKYRLIANACFQKPIAYMVSALIAYLTKDWQYYFIFLNLIASPISIAFMLFLESPRWLVASGRLGEACELLSMFTYAMVSTTYVFVVRGMHEDAILFTFLDGIMRLVVPLAIIFLDFKVKAFGRKLQFIVSLTIICLCYAAVIVLTILGTDHGHVSIIVIVVVATMLNDCAVWMNIVQITTQRFPTVIRCIAFGCTYATRHAGFIVGLMLLRPLLEKKPLWAFIIPEIFLVVTLVGGLFLQPETKGKALLDRLVEGRFGRVENEIPRTAMRAIGYNHFHTISSVPVRQRLQTNMVQINNEPDAISLDLSVK